MNIPTRLLILQRLAAHLETITPDNEYAYDLTGSVYRGRTNFGTETRLPAISILESPHPDIAVYVGQNWDAMRDQWTLLLQGFVDNDMENPTDPAYHLYAEVVRCLSRIIATRPATGTPIYPDEYLLRGLITSLEVAPPVVRPPDDGQSSRAFFFLPLRLGVAVPIWNPYTTV